MDVTQLSYRDMQKLCKENGVKGLKKKDDLMKALQEMFPKQDESCSSSIDQVSKAGMAARKRRALNDISDLTGNPSGRACKVRCSSKNVYDETTTDINLTVGSSLFSEFGNSLKAISSTPIQIDLCDTPVVDQENRLQQFSNKTTSAEENLRNLLLKFEKSTKPILDEIERRKNELENNKCEGDDYLNKILKRELVKKETEVTNLYQERVNQLQNEKNQVVDKCIELERTKQNNENEIDALREKLTVSENKIVEIREEMGGKVRELEEQFETLKSVQLNVKQTTIEEMEEELTCIICQELFLTAMTVPCGHSFCEICLRTWFRTKKTCPVCRSDIKLKVIPSFILDSAVEKIVESLDEDTRRKRVQLKRERNEQKRREDAAPDPQGVRAMFHGVEIVSNTPAAAAAAAAQPAQRNPNANRRRSRSQSPARVPQRAGQTIGQPSRALLNNSNINRNNNSNNVSQLFNQWRNNNNNSNNYQNRYGNNVRCFRCGGVGHVANVCWYR